MAPFFKYYIAAWAMACLVALTLFLRRPAAFAIGRRAYWHFLGQPWKLASFVAASALITVVAPYTGDHHVGRSSTPSSCRCCASPRRRGWWRRSSSRPAAGPHGRRRCVAAGYLWNLEWQRGRGVIFDVHARWMAVTAGGIPVLPLLGYAAISAMPVVMAVLIFFV